MQMLSKTALQHKRLEFEVVHFGCGEGIGDGICSQFEAEGLYFIKKDIYWSFSNVKDGVSLYDYLET